MISTKPMRDRKPRVAPAALAALLAGLPGCGKNERRDEPRPGTTPASHAANSASAPLSPLPHPLGRPLVPSVRVEDPPSGDRDTVTFTPEGEAIVRGGRSSSYVVDFVAGVAMRSPYRLFPVPCSPKLVGLGADHGGREATLMDGHGRILEEFELGGEGYWAFGSCEPGPLVLAIQESIGIEIWETSPVRLRARIDDQIPVSARQGFLIDHGDRLLIPSMHGVRAYDARTGKRVAEAFHYPFFRDLDDASAGAWVWDDHHQDTHLWDPEHGTVVAGSDASAIETQRRAAGPAGKRCDEPPFAGGFRAGAFVREASAKGERQELPLLPAVGITKAGLHSGLAGDPWIVEVDLARGKDAAPFTSMPDVRSQPIFVPANLPWTRAPDGIWTHPKTHGACDVVRVDRNGRRQGAWSVPGCDWPSPDGSRVVVTTPSGAEVRPRDGGAPVCAVTVTLDALREILKQNRGYPILPKNVAVSGAAIAPDGKSFFVAARGEVVNNDADVISRFELDGCKRIWGPKLFPARHGGTPAFIGPNTPRWVISRDGEVFADSGFIASDGTTVWRNPLELDDGQVPNVSTLDAGQAAVAYGLPSGEVLVRRGGVSYPLERADFLGGRRESPIVAASADGHFVARSEVVPMRGARPGKVVVWSVDDGKIRAQANAELFAESIAVADDGRVVVLASNEELTWIALSGADGGEQEARLHVRLFQPPAEGQDVRVLAWSSDGYVDGDPGTLARVRYDVDGALLSLAELAERYGVQPRKPGLFASWMEAHGPRPTRALN